MFKKNFSFCVILLIFSVISYAQTESMTSFDGVNIVFSDEGEGEAVLLLHGFINSRKSWDNTQLKKDLLKKRV